MVPTQPAKFPDWHISLRGLDFDFSQELFRAEIHSLARVERTGLSAAFNLDFIDGGNQPERAFPFPVPTCLAASLLFRIFSVVGAARLAAEGFNL
jgi:hypothetical protein